MRIVREDVTVSGVVIMQVIHQQHPLSFRHLSITIQCGRYVTVEVIDHTALGFPTISQSFCFAKVSAFFANPVLHSCPFVTKLTFSNMPHIKVMF